MKSTQAQRLLDHLEQGRTLTRLQSFNQLGIVELSARVIDLENLGHTIARERVKVTNRFGEKVSVMEYRLEAA